MPYKDPKRRTAVCKAWRAKNPEYRVKYLEENKERISKSAKTWRDQHVQERKEYYTKHKDVLLEYSRTWYQKNKKYVLAKQAKREAFYYRNNMQYRIARNLRARLRQALKKSDKVGSAVRDLGCSMIELQQYLEQKFQPGMTWENYGYAGWHIDHIIPLSSFDLTNKIELLQACHYTNLQPLWARDNLSKGKNII
jgi:hypothetical protein